VIRVLIADDQPLMRGALAMIIGAQPDLEVVAEAADGREAVAQAVRLRPEVAVLDIRMPVLDGLAATRELARLVPGNAVRILILTTFDLDEYVTAALAAGASGFLLKNAPPEDILAGIRTVAAGESLLAPTVTTRLLSRFRAAAAAVDPRRAATLDQLTPRETEVLRGIARGASNSEIGAQLHIGETTVKTHVSRILAKIGARDRVQAVIFAYEAGLVAPGSDH
jgi:DNA-binding NarL/FixJ family response regulator